MDKNLLKITLYTNIFNVDYDIPPKQERDRPKASILFLSQFRIARGTKEFR